MKADPFEDSCRRVLLRPGEADDAQTGVGLASDLEQLFGHRSSDPATFELRKRVVGNFNGTRRWRADKGRCSYNAIGVVAAKIS
jgi:hypothetical protein